MGKRIDDDIKRQIPILYKKLGNKKQVAKELGISPSTVSRYLNLFEAAPQLLEEPKKRRVIEVTDELIEKVNELYKQSRNLSQVSRELDIPTSTVKRLLNEENLKLKNNQNDDRDALFYYILKLFGEQTEEEPVSSWNIIQMQTFQKQGMPYQGQLLTLKYFFEVTKHSTEKSNGSIGIIPYVYEQARSYYSKQAQKADDISAAIYRQLEKDRIEIPYNPSNYFGRKKKKKIIDLNTLQE